MFRINKIIWVLLLIGFASSEKLKSNNYKIVTRLYGYWKFSIGDDPKWSNPSFDDKNWDNIYVPASWEENGYERYNGFAWYRKKFELPNVSYDVPLYLMIGKIDDVDEVYLNGKLIGTTGSYPPNFHTRWEIQRQYIIPKNLLNYNGVNTIAVRVYDSHGPGGIRSGNVGLYIDGDYFLLDLPLNGNWKFSLGNKREWREPDYNDSRWQTLIVPSSWDKQGYEDYDGYGCYRHSFVIPSNLKGENLYLSLGKIDDVDEVYFNGYFIGSVYDISGKNRYNSNQREYMVPRIYLLPKDKIKFNGKNTITVVVYDSRSRGGIYEGPVGIMKESNLEKLKNNKEEDYSFWDLLYEWLVD